MELSRRLLDMLRLPRISAEAVAVWVCLGFAGYLLLDEWARWLSAV